MMGGGPRGHGGPGGPGGPGGFGGPGRGFGGGPGGFGGGGMPPPPPPRGWGRWGGGYRRGCGCLGCLLPILAVGALVTLALVLLF